MVDHQPAGAAEASRPQFGARLIVASSPERNDRKYRPKGGFARPSGGPTGAAKPQQDKAAVDWLWGWHAVVAALDNPRRAPPRRLLATEDRAKTLTDRFGKIATLEVVEAALVGKPLPSGAAHQGGLDDLQGGDFAEAVSQGLGPLLGGQQPARRRAAGIVQGGHHRVPAPDPDRSVVRRRRGISGFTAAFAVVAFGGRRHYKTRSVFGPSFDGARGGMSRAAKGADCKSAGVRLRRFESYFPHHAQPGVRPRGAEYRRFKETWGP